MVGTKGPGVDRHFNRQEKYYSAVHARWDKERQAAIGSPNTGKGSLCPRGGDGSLLSLEGCNVGRDITGGVISSFTEIDRGHTSASVGDRANIRSEL